MCDCIDKTLETVSFSPSPDDIKANHSARGDEPRNLKPAPGDEGERQAEDTERDNAEHGHRPPLDARQIGENDEHETRSTREPDACPKRALAIENARPTWLQRIERNAQLEASA